MIRHKKIDQSAYFFHDMSGKTSFLGSVASSTIAALLIVLIIVMSFQAKSFVPFLRESKNKNSSLPMPDMR